MEYLLIAVIAFLASFMGASLAQNGFKPEAPVTKIVKKISEKREQKTKETQNEVYNNWLYHGGVNNE